jgi:SAM-dependent methyltransferase
VHTLCEDLERNPVLPLNGYDLISVFNFLHRPLLPAIAAALRPGGLIVYETFVHPQREQFGKPRRDAFLLQPGELAAAFAGWQILKYAEGPTGPRRIAASLIARHPE